MSGHIIGTLELAHKSPAIVPITHRGHICYKVTNLPSEQWKAANWQAIVMVRHAHTLPVGYMRW